MRFAERNAALQRRAAADLIPTDFQRAFLRRTGWRREDPCARLFWLDVFGGGFVRRWRRCSSAVYFRAVSLNYYQAPSDVSVLSCSLRRGSWTGLLATL